MKYLQVGILAALILVAGLLGLNLMQDRQPEANREPIPATVAEQAEAPELATDEIAANVSPVADEKASADAQPRRSDANGGAVPKAPATETAPRAAASTASKPAVRENTEIASARPAPTQPRQQTASANPAASRPPQREESLVVDPPQSADSWGDSQTTSASADQDRNRYELMRPQQVRPATPASTASAIPEPPRSVTLPSGTILTVRTTRTLSSETATTDEVFTGTLDQPIVHEDLVIAERGSRVEGRVVQVVDSGRVKGVAALSVQLTSINTSDGQKVPVQTQTFTMDAEKSTKGDATKVGIATGLGAALGAIFGGGKGAAIGAAAGAGAGTGTVLATKGKPAEIPSETRINFRLEAPLTLTEKINP